MKRAFVQPYAMVGWCVLECTRVENGIGEYWRNDYRHGDTFGKDVLTLRQALELEDKLNAQFAEEGE